MTLPLQLLEAQEPVVAAGRSTRWSLGRLGRNVVSILADYTRLPDRSLMPAAGSSPNSWNYKFMSCWRSGRFWAA